MGTMDSCPKHSPPSCSERNDVVITRQLDVPSDVPKDVKVSIDRLNAITAASGDPNFPPRPCVKDASYSSTDEEEATVTGISSLPNDSDCDTVLTVTTNTSRGVGCRNPSSAASVGSSGTASSCSSGAGGGSKTKYKVHQMSNTNVSDIDKMIIKDLQGLSVKDRGLVQEEIHGVSTCAVSEDGEKIAESLKLFEEEIRAIRREILVSPTQESRAGNSYDDSIWSYLAVEDDGSSPSAVTVNSRTRLLYSYIFHPSFRLKFLRADLFDIEKAAHRYLRCLEGLLKYFGSYALQRPIMYEDLGKECQDAAKSGYVQILPSRDRAGRLVVVSQATHDDGVTMAIILKLYTYIFSVVSEDIETQRRGVIFVFSSSEEALRVLQDPTDKMEYAMYREGSPVRRSCTHFCLPEDNPKMRLIRAVMTIAMPREERFRTRIHMDGLTMETQYKLMTFGIPVSELPITSTGGIKTKHHLQWIRTRKALDSSRMKSLEACYSNKIQRQEGEKRQRAVGTTPHTEFCIFPTHEEFLSFHGSEPIIHPMINDVLFSKGGKNVTHYGNIEFTDLMKRSLLQYVQGTPLQNRKMRKAIRQSIVDEVQTRGGRFLTLDKKLRGGYCWTEIQEGPDLHDRIATSLYDHKRRLAAKLKVQKNRCGTAMFTELDKSKRRKIVTDDGEPNPDRSCCSLNLGDELR